MNIFVPFLILLIITIFVEFLQGIQSILPLISNRIVKVSRADILMLLTDEDSDAPPEIARFSADCQQTCSEISERTTHSEYFTCAVDFFFFFIIIIIFFF